MWEVRVWEVRGKERVEKGERDVRVWEVRVWEVRERGRVNEGD